MEREPLDILRVTASVYPEQTGGMALHVDHMSRVQAELGHNVTVLTSDNGDRSLPRTEERNGYSIRRCKEFVSPLDNTIAPEFVRALDEHAPEYDIVHAHSHLFFVSNVAALLNRVRDYPFVVTNHGLVSQTAPRWMQKVLLPILTRGTFNVADRVFCYTETERDELRGRGIKAPVSVIQNGIDCTRFEPGERTPTDKQILFVGRLTNGKGVTYLLDAFASLQNSHPETSLKIVGDGPLREDLAQRVAEKGIGSSVEFTGMVPNTEMPRIYNESTVFVLPSLSEGVPRTMLEAMACGVPVVTTELSQIVSIVDGAGFTVPRRSSDTICDRLQTLLDNPEQRREFARIGRAKVEDQFSWQDTVEQTTECYYQVLEQFE